MRRTALAFCAFLTLPLAPALGAAARPAGPVAANSGQQAAIPTQIPATERARYRMLFAALADQRWDEATAQLSAMPEGPLQAYAQAELFLAPNSPAVDGSAIVALLERAPELPQAGRLAQLARTRGILSVPAIPAERRLISLPGASRRGQAQSNRSDATAREIGPRIVQFIKDDRPADAEALLDSHAGALSNEALTEWQQRVAWSYYLTGDDGNARRLATMARGGSGEWVPQASWVAGLAAWRTGDWDAAAEAFDRVASQGRDYETRAAGLFWAARADAAAGRAFRVQPRLRSASRLPETFYGLLASSVLGITLPASNANPGPAVWQALSRYPTVRLATALAEIGETGHAETVLRHQARIGSPQEHGALLHLASLLKLPSAQLWLARNGPAGMEMPESTRYPMPAWMPQGGWRVDPALIYAHSLQESQFRPDAVSRAGAVGLMQIMPGTAQQIARRKGETIQPGALNMPAVSFEYGQSYLEMLRDAPGTDGLLPKIIAAYNAGPGSVLAWNYRVRHGGDPLLFIESIPFVETRGYVATVLRNYWMYARQQGRNPDSLKAMAQGMWPRFPGLPGSPAIRLGDNQHGRAARVETARVD